MMTELRKKSDDQLRTLINDDREKLRLLRFDMTTKKIKDIHDLRKTKKRIAQMLTILSERSTSTTDAPARSASPLSSKPSF